MLRTVDEDILQSWVDSVSEGAAQAFLLCADSDRPIGWAGLASADGERMGLVVVVLGGEMANEVIRSLEHVHGASISVDGIVES